MRYITIIIVVVCYFFLMSIGLNLLLKDSLIVSASPVGNDSFISINASSINMTTEEIPDEVSLKSFPSALKVMFGFRTPIPDAIPATGAAIISFMNWFLMILLGISLYRVINPLA